MVVAELLVAAWVTSIDGRFEKDRQQQRNLLGGRQPRQEPDRGVELVVADVLRPDHLPDAVASAWMTSRARSLAIAALLSLADWPLYHPGAQEGSDPWGVQAPVVPGDEPNLVHASVHVMCYHGGHAPPVFHGQRGAATAAVRQRSSTQPSTNWWPSTRGAAHTPRGRQAANLGPADPLQSLPQSRRPADATALPCPATRPGPPEPRRGHEPARHPARGAAAPRCGRLLSRYAAIGPRLGALLSLRGFPDLDEQVAALPGLAPGVLRRIIQRDRETGRSPCPSPTRSRPRLHDTSHASWEILVKELHGLDAEPSDAAGEALNAALFRQSGICASPDRPPPG